MPRPKPIRVCRPERGRAAGGVGALLNLGPKSEAWLVSIGVTTRDQLAKLGPIGTCRRLRDAGRPVSVLMAYAIEGALTGTHWNALAPETKHWLRAEFAQLRREQHSPPTK